MCSTLRIHRARATTQRSDSISHDCLSRVRASFVEELAARFHWGEEEDLGGASADLADSQRDETDTVRQLLVPLALL